MKRAPEAEEAFRRLVELRPRYADGWYNLGSALAAQGKLKESSDCYREVLRYNPADKTAAQRLELLSKAMASQPTSGAAD